MIYFVIIAFLFFCAYKYDSKPNKKNIRIFCFCYIALVCLAGFRYRIGLDTIRYEQHYSYALPLSQLTMEDIFQGEYSFLYILLQGVAKEISDEFYIMQFIHAIIVNFSVFLFIKKNTNAQFLALLLYFILVYHEFCFEVMRESLAVSMFLLSWTYFKNNKWWYYMLFATFAFGFHHSAIFLYLLPLIKLPIIKSALCINKKIIIVSVICLILGYYLQNKFFDYFLLLDWQDAVADRINSYNNSDYGGQTLNIFGIISVFILRVFYPMYIIMRYKKRNKVYIELESIVALFIIFSVLSIPITIFYRMTSYTYLFVILMYANYSSIGYGLNIRNTQKYLIYLPLVLFTFWGFLGKEKSQHVYNRYFPYYSIFTKNVDWNREKLYNDYSL